MATELIRDLLECIGEEIDGLRISGEGLRTDVDARYASVTVEVDYDLANEAVRVSTTIAVPPGTGKAFLLWCLSMNVSYWDVKIGVDEDGRLVVHSDLDAPDDVAITDLANEVVDRVDSVVEFLDDDLVGWLVAHDLGTPAQQARWRRRSPGMASSEE